MKIQKAGCNGQLFGNREIGIILMDAGHISEFETWFEQDWKDSI